MIQREHVRVAKRIVAVVGAVSAIGGVTYAAASAVAKSDDTQRRLVTVEDTERELAEGLARLEGKVDALLLYFRVPVAPGGAP